MKHVSEIFLTPGTALANDADGVGIEIEVEGRNLPKYPALWRVDKDDSLKSAENAEYVLYSPMSKVAAMEALDQLYDLLNAPGTEMFEAVTAGVHIHLNFQRYSLKELFTFIVTYLMVEDLLVEYCGEYREGNHFCLRASDAPALILHIWEAMQQKNIHYLNTEDIRYSSMNVTALFKYGSLEFRAMRSTPDRDVVKTWIELLFKVREYAKRFDSPEDVIKGYSTYDSVQLIEEIFQEHAGLFLNTSDYRKRLKSGMRNAQEIAYSVNWDDFCSVFDDNIFLSVGDIGL